MSVGRLDYFYDEQIKSYLKQIVAAFYGFCVETTTRDGQKVLRQVPVRWGSPSKMAAFIIKQNSENVINSAPFITVTVAGMEHAPNRRQNPQFVESLKVAERKYDEGGYTTGVGNKFSVERHMPVPYNMNIQLDIWTSNIEQKLQLFEQISVLFNPSIDYQSNTNPLDWSALTYLEQTGLTWSSRTIPVGTDTQIDILTWTFLAPIYINPPAKVKRQSVIHQIVTNITNHDCFAIGTDNTYTPETLLSQVITTPENHMVNVEDGEVTLLNAHGRMIDDNGNIFSWKDLLAKYGHFIPDVTTLRLKRYALHLDDYSRDVVGTLQHHPTKKNVLLFNLDINTLPINTLPPVDGIIDPHSQFPGFGLPIQQAGQRYLLTRNIWTPDIGGEDKDNESGATVSWGGLVAKEHDIIEYNGQEWFVSYSAIKDDTQFVMNNFTEKQLVFDGTQWILSIEGVYSQGYWRLGIAGVSFGPDEDPCA